MNINKNKNLDENAVVVGMTGGIHSLVTAFLLKKQGLKVYAVAINFKKPYPELEAFEDTDGFSTKSKPKIPFIGVYLLDELEIIKEKCDSLNISFYAADGSDRYESTVTNQLITSKINGKEFGIEIHATEVLLEVLREKADILKAKWISTGHKAKIVHHKGGNISSLYSNRNIDNDKSHLLSLVPSNILNRCIFPLESMKEDAISKILNMSGVKQLETRLTDKNIREHKQLGEFINRLIAPILRSKGAVVDYFNDNTLFDHEGIHYFYNGQNNIESDKKKRIDDNLTILNIDSSSGTIYVGDKSHRQIKYMSIDRLRVLDGIDVSVPLSVLIKVINEKKFINGTLCFKNNNHALVSLENRGTYNIFIGENICFYLNDQKSARLIGTGKINNLGILRDNKITEILKMVEIKEYDFEKDEEIIDITLAF